MLLKLFSLVNVTQKTTQNSEQNKAERDLSIQDK